MMENRKKTKKKEKTKKSPIMCGRMNVIADPLTQLVSEMLGIKFTTETNTNLCPSETVATFIHSPDSYQQINASWGIQPQWSRRLLINAQSETVASKPTFKNAFNQARCLIPCSGWYEWRTEAGKKVKYAFTHHHNEPLFMAGILYQPAAPQLVTLTTAPNNKCAQYHKRMPVLILPEQMDYWFNSTPEQLSPLMNAVDEKLIKVASA